MPGHTERSRPRRPADGCGSSTATTPSTAPAAEEDALSARLATMAHLEATIARPQATAWLWDFGAAPDATAPDASTAGDGVLGCMGVAPVEVRPTGLSQGPLGTGHAT